MLRDSVARAAKEGVKKTIRRITSRHNPIVARYRATARGDTAGLMLLDGAHLIAEALATETRIQHAAVRTEALERTDIHDLVQELRNRGVMVDTAAPSVMDALSPLRSSSPLVAIAERPPLDAGRGYQSAAPLVLIAVDVQDPGNLGALVRVAEAGGASGVVAAGACADPFGWKALRGSMGSALRLPIATSDDAGDAIGEARRRGCRIAATAPRGGRSLFDVDLTARAAVLIGSEGTGLLAALVESADERVTIPMCEPVESLNAAVTAALIVYEARRQRQTS